MSCIREDRGLSYLIQGPSLTVRTFEQKHRFRRDNAILLRVKHTQKDFPSITGTAQIDDDIMLSGII
jgi:hypothetical protein